MKAAVMRDGRLLVDDLAEFSPQPGQVIAEVIACGICGSDLHALHHADQLVEMARVMSAEAGPFAPAPMDASRDVVMGHEFSARVIEVGPNVNNLAVGDVVVSLPIVMDAGGLHALGYDNTYPGGFAQQIALSEVLCSKVPNGLDPHLAALTEPMSVGAHAVHKSVVTPKHAAVVLGCGPVGLAVIAALQSAGVETILASDYSASRRALASVFGASEVTDPAVESPIAIWRRIDGRRALVIFEAVGVPGMLESAMLEAPRAAQILVVGVCMVADSFRPMIAVGKELNLQFVFGYDPGEFADTLHRISEGEYPVSQMITATVPLEGVADAFTALGDPDSQAKILVTPNETPSTRIGAGKRRFP